jgi:hypothetical protein
VSNIVLDLNHEVFQRDLFALNREDAFAIFATLKKIQRLDWSQLYVDPGLRWEAIQTRSRPNGTRYYSIRITRRVRAVAFREGDVLRFVEIHPDHDSAYMK